jgi:rhodanese-related sulfurtransferase
MFRRVSLCSVFLAFISHAAFAAGTKSVASVQASAKSLVSSPVISTDELKEALAKKLPWMIIDVRTPEEHAAGHIPGSVNIPLDTLEKRYAEIPKDKVVILTCRSGRRSGLAQETLAKFGYTNTRNHTGGISGWTGPVEK